MALSFVGVVNEGDFYSPHYLEALLESDLSDVFKAWRELRSEDPVRRFARLAAGHFKALEAWQDAAPEARLEHARKQQGALLAALGYELAPTLARLEDDRALPLRGELRRGGAPWLWVVEVLNIEGEAEDEDPLAAPPIPGAQALDEGEAWASESWRELLDRGLFRLDEAPRWVLALGLRRVWLIDRDKWGQGRCLRFELDELFARKEEGALKACVGLLHRDIVAPREGGCVHDSLDENSHKHAYAVSTDLKEGAREAIELIANEALRYKREVTREAQFSTNTEALAEEIKTEAITYIYRLIFLFYVEARAGESGIVPMGSDAYRLGYSLESLRELELAPLTSVEAQEGFYIHHSLEKLFALVNKGAAVQAQRGLTFSEAELRHRGDVSITPLRSPLFDPRRTRILSSVKLRNVVLQEVIRELSLSRPGKGKRRGRISYAQLGINQLGAVYESLLSYSGFFARERVYAVRHPREMSDPEARTWFVPESEIQDYEDSEIAQRDGQRERYARGTFLFRLTGRDRETSASYYTPEVLTRCLVKYTLQERLRTVSSAAEVLELTVCEPAMGSGAFLVEAVNQLAEAYLTMRQRELGRELGSEEAQLERQKVKRWITVHNVYGVDLNPLAADLGKLSLWLNCLHRGAQAPYLELNLRAGNSLIGGRRDVYEGDVFCKVKGRTKGDYWSAKAPRRLDPGEARPAGAIYHFLLGFGEMAPYDKDKVIKGLLPEPVKALKAWRKGFVAPLTEFDVKALEDLSARVDELWEAHRKARVAAKHRIREGGAFFGFSAPREGPPLKFAACEEGTRELRREGAPGMRLQRVMDYWCALWFWPLERAGSLPTWQDWLADLPRLLDGVLPGELDTDDGLRQRWGVVEAVLERQRFMHWELAFPEALLGEGGGFDLIVGNPPWIKVEWNEQGILGDLQPRTALRRMSAKQVAELRKDSLARPDDRARYLGEMEGSLAAAAFLNSKSNYELLQGVQTNLYKCFLVVDARLTNVDGAAGLIHGKGIYDDPKGSKLREWLSARLLWRFHFLNKLMLFAGITDKIHYEATIIGPNKHKPTGRQLVNLFHPKTIDESLDHSISEPVPVMKTPEGSWETRGHRSRVIELDDATLQLFAELFDEPGTPARQARLPLVFSQEAVEVLRKFAQAPRRLADLEGDYFATVCFDETYAQRDGTIRRETRFPEAASEWVLSGPHFHVANPLAKTPNEGCRHNQDYSSIDLTTAPDDYLPRTNYVPDAGLREDNAPRWKKRPVYSYYRHVHREMVAPTGERTLVPALIPKQATHVHTVFAVGFESLLELLGFSAMSSSIPVDFFIKSTGSGHVNLSLVRRIPLPSDGRYGAALRSRVLRLNCVTTPYAELWESCRPTDFQSVAWAKSDPRLKPWNTLTATWTRDCALRTPFERRQALVEIDALAALELGISADELCAIYRSQFWVLQQYEADTWYDRRGMIVFTNNRGLSDVGLPRKDWEEIRGITDPAALPELAAGFVPPFDRCDREEDMRQAFAAFEARLAEEPPA